MATAPAIQLPRLTKRQMAELKRKATSLGVSPQRYLQLLIEEDLALDRKARSTTFAELMGPGRDLDEAALDRLVDQSRTRHYQSTRAKR